jgi:hypothetical protein
MYFMTKVFLIILFSLLPFTVLCQAKITGQVLSDKQKPLAGASVFIPNTTIGTLTNANGEFTLNDMPVGNTRIVISFIGYKTAAITVSPANAINPYIVNLAPYVRELEGVVVNNFDPDGWEHWGESFIVAFIGTSAYASECNITNKEVLNFTFNSATKTLNAYASAPLEIENRALGYRITANLVDFKYDVQTNDVDYLVYSFFDEMKGIDSEERKWKKNRSNVYKYSLMHFMRSLYAGTTTAEGYQIRRLVKRRNVERQRVQEIYARRFQQIKDSLTSTELKESAVHKLIEKSFSRDSLKYYRKILEQDEGIKKLHEKSLDDKLITSKTDSNLVKLHFQDHIVVTYMKSHEPEEYYKYKTAALESKDFEYRTTNLPGVSWPVTELILQQGIPIEISSNGYFTNIDLFIDGFWGWWEKMATKLPYGYEP